MMETVRGRDMMGIDDGDSEREKCDGRWCEGSDGKPVRVRNQ